VFSTKILGTLADFFLLSKQKDILKKFININQNPMPEPSLLFVGMVHLTKKENLKK
jgi:hypothetical protein